MSTVKPGMLPGDEFSFEEWQAAIGKPRSTPVDLPDPVRLAYLHLLEQCQKYQIPHVAIFALQGGDRTLYDILDKPENVSHQLLLARSSTVGDMIHNTQLMLYGLKGFDLSKLTL